MGFNLRIPTIEANGNKVQMSDIGSETKPMGSGSNLERKDEDEYIHLLEDLPLGKIVLICVHLKFVFCFYGALFLYSLYLAISVLLSSVDVKEWPSRLGLLLKRLALPLCTPFILLIRPYVRFFWLNQACVTLRVLVYLLKEVELQSSRDSNIDWRQIACLANQLAWELDDRDEVFYSGDHCRKYFDKYIAGVVRDESYEVNTTCPELVFGSVKSHKDLLNRSVQAYQRCAETVHEV